MPRETCAPKTKIPNDYIMDLGMKSKAQTKPKNRVGLDIGNGSIKMVELSNVGGKFSLVGFGSKKIESARREDIIDAIKALTSQARISAKDASVSVSGPSVIVRFITVPKMSEEDLKGAIRFEAEKFIPFNINDCIVDFQTLKKDKTASKLDILLVASKKEPVWEKVKLAEGAGFSVSMVDVDSFALANSFSMNFPAAASSEKDKTVALLNIGTNFTNFSILTGPAISFVRDVAIGGNELNAAISKMLGVTVREAEELKLSPGDKAQEVTSCIKTVLGNLLDEVKLSFSYHENQKGRGVDEVYISGGGSELANLEAVFAEALGSKLIFWDPFKFLDTKIADPSVLDKTKGQFAVALGLALR